MCTHCIFLQFTRCLHDILFQIGCLFCDNYRYLLKTATRYNGIERHDTTLQYKLLNNIAIKDPSTAKYKMIGMIYLGCKSKNDEIIFCKMSVIGNQYAPIPISILAVSVPKSDLILSILDTNLVLNGYTETSEMTNYYQVFQSHIFLLLLIRLSEICRTAGHVW